MTSDPFTQRIADLLGPAGLIADPAGMAPYLEEERGLFHGKARLVARPASTTTFRSSSLRNPGEKKVTEYAPAGNGPV